MGARYFSFIENLEPKAALRRKLKGAESSRPTQRMVPLVLGRRGSSGDIVERRVGNLVAIDLRNSVNHSRQEL
ncbi:MAG: hypothetical protein WA644_16865, partial [Candidatus Acidiferrales bacterium]